MVKYFSFSLLSFKILRVYKLDLLFRICATILVVFAIRQVWTAIYKSSDTIVGQTGIELNTMVIYATLSIIISSVLAPAISYEMSDKVNKGDIIVDLQKPWNFQTMYLFKSFGNCIFGLFFVAFPITVLSILLFHIAFPNLIIMIYFLMSLFFGILLSFYINFIVGLFSFVFTEVWGFEYVKKTIQEFCSGSFVPLWFFPHYIENMLNILPFKGIYYIPLSIFIGKLKGEGIYTNLLFQLCWIIALMLVGQLTMKFFERKLILNGG